MNQPSHPAVKVIFRCPEDPSHTLGVVGRQVHGVPGVAAGREISLDVRGGLTVRTGPNVERKLVGQCRTCHAGGSRRTSQLRWEKVQLLLDQAEAMPNGIMDIPFKP